MTDCPHCGSGETASRRALFRRLVRETAIDEAFAWYGLSDKGACPPKSLFVTLLSLLPVMALPAGLAWFLNSYPVLPWLAGAAALLALALVIDAGLTYRRYRDWASRWLCGDCRGDFSLSGAGRRTGY